MKKTIGTFAVLISSLALGKDIPTIAVNGVGSISAKPDTMSIIANVETKNTNSQKAVEENNTIVKKAIELLKKDGLTDSNIKIENYNLNYRKDYNSKSDEMNYFVNNQIIITTKNLEKAGELLGVLNNSGVSNINNVNFFISNKKELENKAYKLAYTDAKNKAKLIAKMDDFKISPKYIDLGYSNPRPYPVFNMTRANSSDVPVTIPESISVTANINATFYMKK